MMVFAMHASNEKKIFAKTDDHDTKEIDNVWRRDNVSSTERTGSGCADAADVAFIAMR